MKNFIFNIGFLAAVVSLAASPVDPLGDIRSASTEVRERFNTAGIDGLTLQQLSTLQTALTANKPSPWMLDGEYLEHIRALVDDLQPLALELANHEDPSYQYHAATLLAFQTPTVSGSEALHSLAQDSNAETAITALDALFGFGTASSELRQAVVDATSDSFIANDQSVLSALTRNNVGRWGVEEAIPILIAQLKSQMESGAKIDRSLVRQLTFFGKAASSAYPLLAQLYTEESNRETPNYRLLEDLVFSMKATNEGSQEYSEDDAMSVRSKWSASHEQADHSSNQNLTSRPLQGRAEFLNLINVVGLILIVLLATFLIFRFAGRGRS